MQTCEQILDIIRAGLGEVPCDLKLTNLKLVNVYSSEIYPTDIFIRNGRIVSIDPEAGLSAEQTIDCGGRYAVPGFIDTHMHFETTMLCPESLADVVVPCGTTTLCADLMEIANVAGADGLKAMLLSRDRLPYRMLIEVSSRVPTAPGLETTGAYMGAEEVDEIMKWPEAVSLGELDPSKILFPKEEYLQKIANTMAKRKIVNGHAIGRMGQELNVYASSGISDDHECVEPEELLARLRAGMRVLIREGSTERNLDRLITGVQKAGLGYENLMFCTDDKHAVEIRGEGHINYNVARSIELGVPPIEAIKMATISAARHFRLEDEIGSVTPGRRADILLLPDLETIRPDMVFFEGRLAAENGALTEPCPSRVYPDWIKETVTLKNPITASSFVKKSKYGGKASVRVIDLIDRQIINRQFLTHLPCENGALTADVSRDIAKLAVVERYGKTGGVGIGFVRGFGLKTGALAYSTSHDHHNIVTVGTSDEDMALAVNTVANMQGGLSVVCDGDVLACMSLPIGGLMSEEPADVVMHQQEEMNRAARSLGCVGSAPFMTLSFISLPTVPELGLTDLGLIDVLQHRCIDLEADPEKTEG